MTNITPELIEKAKATKSAEELLALAKENNVEMNEEQAKVIFSQLNTSGELSEDELDNVSGGGCQTKVGGEKYTIVTAWKRCFTGQWERYFVLSADNREYGGSGPKWCCPSGVDNDEVLHALWGTDCSDGACGSCKHLRFKGGIGYCSKS